MASTDTNITNTPIEITVDREAGTITVNDPTGTETGTVRVYHDGLGWTRTNLDGHPVSMYGTDRDSIIDETIAGYADVTDRPVNITGA